MNVRWFYVAGALAVALFAPVAAVRADQPASYDSFVAGLTPMRGLFPLWQKGGKLYLEIAADQFDRDFIETIVPSTGTGGPGIVWGNTDYQSANLVRFERAGSSVAILWPAPYFTSAHDPSAARAIDSSFAKSIVALAPIAAVDPASGRVIVEASSFLDDQMNLHDVLKDARSDDATQFYTLDRDRSYFGKTKAFADNDVIEAKQDWYSPDIRLNDAVPDPRHLLISVTYNLVRPPVDDGYVPRISDDRIGIYDDVYMTYDDDEVRTRKLRYAVRWNLRPSDPSKAVSPATHPMVFTMSDSIPERYRPAIRAAVLEWNAAFLKIGISDAVRVVDQPSDPAFDPDDARYNMLRWITEYRASFGADSQTLYDPRTGEEFRTGILISSDVPTGTYREWHDVVDPVRYGRSTDPMPQSFLDDAWKSVILHETGHNLGLQHNFIGSRAYTARELQDPQFTATYGIASTVMEYAPLNIWPRGTGQGTYAQTVLGPYDYHAIAWTYATIPGAATPEAEVPALEKIAAQWSDPKYRYASDEDVSWTDGHAADPRVEQGILTDDPIGWCAVQLPLERGLMSGIGKMQPAVGAAFEDETNAFVGLLGRYTACAQMPARYIGGQYLSRAHRGDPKADPPVVPVPRREQYRAFAMLDRYVFAADALHFAPSLLDQLGTSEWAGYGFGDVAANRGQLQHWAYDPPLRHDIALGERVAALQDRVLDQLLLPPVLARIVDGEAESGRDTMHLGDLFAWLHASVFREIGRDGTIVPGRRALQARYAQRLAAMYAHPPAGLPSDARAFARAELAALAAQCAKAERAGGVTDAVVRAHLGLLEALAKDALASGRAA